MRLLRFALCSCLIGGLGTVFYPVAKQKYVDYRTLCRLKCLADMTSLYSKERAEIECMPPNHSVNSEDSNIDVPPVPS